jgi:hypothetical protein
MTRNSSSSTALDELNQWLNLLQSVQLPFALIPVLAFNASEALMGKKFANSGLMVAVTVLISLLVMLVNVVGVMAFTEAALDGAGMFAWGLFGLAMVIYLFLVAFVFIHATAAAGVLPAAARLIAVVPGGGDGSSIGGGAFRRIPSGLIDQDAEAAAAIPGVGWGAESVTGGGRGTLAAGFSGRGTEGQEDVRTGNIGSCAGVDLPESHSSSPGNMQGYRIPPAGRASAGVQLLLGEAPAGSSSSSSVGGGMRDSSGAEQRQQQLRQPLLPVEESDARAVAVASRGGNGSHSSVPFFKHPAWRAS